MNIETFKRILTSFADEKVNIDLHKDKVVVQIKDEIIEANLILEEANLYVQEPDSEPISAFNWIRERIARLSILADRIVDQIPPEQNFVTPSGHLLDDLNEDTEGEEDVQSNAIEAIETVLERTPAGVTNVLYLTSDAGEGKTTLLNQVSIEQAKKFKQKETSWLIVPINLSGRPFMALDDIVAAELSNRYRFLLYYEAFIELVRLNLIVPAFDGFEEVFMETASGEAVSALGNLLNQLNGSGRALIAARKAYFEIRSFASQARLYDTIGENAGATFSRLALSRWSRSKFEEYAQMRGVADTSELYNRVAERLNADHPLLTRAVLVQRLVDVAIDDEMDELLDQLGTEPEDYFFQFVNTIVERESRKWIDRAVRGDTAVKLLTVEEHHELLVRVAHEMWINSTDSLSDEYIKLVADIFASDKQISATETHQVRERLHQHSLLVSTKNRREIAFDHEDFKRFYQGQALGEVLSSCNQTEILTFIRVTTVGEQTADAAVNYLQREGADLDQMIEVLTTISRTATDTSYEKENASLLMVRILEIPTTNTRTVSDLMVPANGLQGRRLRDVVIEDSFFQPTALAEYGLKNVQFIRCSFERLDIRDKTDLEGISFQECEVRCLDLPERDSLLFTPSTIDSYLQELGANVISAKDQVELEFDEDSIDEHTKRASTALRAFMRATHLNENVFKQKLGINANAFLDETLPILLEEKILEEVDYTGGGNQRRFKLSVPMRNIEPAVRTAHNMEEFISILKGKD